MWHVVKFKKTGGQDEPCHWRDETPKRGGAWPKDRGRSMIKCQTTSSRGTPERSLVAGYSALVQRPRSLKRERTPAPQPSGSMPTQSPAQKNTKLKSVVYKSPTQTTGHSPNEWLAARQDPTIPLDG